MSMTSSLNPDHLVPAASLNRVRIVDLPGVALEPEVRGRLAYDLLSTQALAAHIRERGTQLGLVEIEDLHDAALPLLLDRCLASTEPTVRSTAEALAADFGRSLGILLLTLTRGDSANRAAREDWDDSYWAYWHSVRRVMLGGGLVGGRLGQHLLPHAQSMLAEQNADCTIEIAAYPALLPLIGAARSLQIENGNALVCDYGQSRIKRACAVFEGGRFVALRTLPTAMMDWTIFDDAVTDQSEQATRLAGSLAQSIQSTLAELKGYGLQTAPAIGISVASYIADGRPLPRQGGPYADMHTLEQPLERWLADRLSQHQHTPVSLMLLHDGTAAARAVDETTAGAVIMLGTALGVGFPRRTTTLRPVSPGLLITTL